MTHNFNLDNKIKEKQEYIEKYNEAIKNGFELLEALEDYDKATINKTFFEKYFILKDDKGEARKDWKGVLYTKFKLSEQEYSWKKGYTIHLAGYEKVDDIENRDRLHIIERTKDKIQCLKNWRDNAIVERDLYKNLDIDAFIKDIKSVYDKYGVMEEYTTIHDMIKFI